MIRLNGTRSNLSDKNFLVVERKLFGQWLGFFFIIHVKFRLEVIGFAYFIGLLLVLAAATHGTAHDRGKNDEDESNQDGNSGSKWKFMETGTKAFAVMMFLNDTNNG